jgi:hypothetical protein
MAPTVPGSAVPVGNVDAGSTDQMARIKAFCASVIKTLAPPLLREVESSAKLRATAEPFTPKRVTRRSNLGAETGCTAKAKKASAAESVLLKALGIVPAELAVDEEDVKLFRQMFDSPIREQQLRVVAAIFWEDAAEEPDGYGEGAGADHSSVIVPSWSGVCFC